MQFRVSSGAVELCLTHTIWIRDVQTKGLQAVERESSQCQKKNGLYKTTIQVSILATGLCKS